MSIDTELKKIIIQMNSSSLTSELGSAQEQPEALAFFTNDAVMCDHVARLSVSQGCFLKAERFARKAYQLYPARTAHLEILAQCMVALRSYDKAIQLCEQGLQQTGAQESRLQVIINLARFGKAELFMRGGLLERAITEGRTALAGLQEHRPGVPCLATSLARIGEELVNGGLIDLGVSCGLLASRIDPYCVAVCSLMTATEKAEAKVQDLVKQLFVVEESARLEAAARLMCLESQHATQSFIVLIEDPCPMLRERAMLYLKRFRIGCWYTVVHLLYDDVDYVRMACAEYLASCEEEFAMDHLELAMAQEEDDKVKMGMTAAACALRARLEEKAPLALLSVSPDAFNPNE